jgi:methyltransferase (TIGR00027 family)
MSQPSTSARIAAFARAYHQQHDQPQVFSDTLAIKLFSQEELGAFEANLARSLAFFDAEAAAAQPNAGSALRHVMRNHVAPITLARSRYAEDALERSVQQGARQYVLLGAGFDTFAFRRPDLAQKLRVFELDDPATQDEKKRRTVDAGWTFPNEFKFVPINFTKGDLGTRLSAAAFDPQLPTFFSLLGVSYYLPREVLLRIFQSVASPGSRGSTIVFDYFDLDAFDPAKASPRMRRMQAAAEFSGEPMLTGLAPDALSKELGSAGFTLRDQMNPSQIQARYFDGQGNGYRMIEQVHFATAEVS